MRPAPPPGLEALAAVSLEELDAAAALRSRFDTKYLVSVEVLPALLERLAGDHAVLEIDGRRAFRYRTAYFDTPQLTSYREHMQGRRLRFKARVRHYVETDVRFFEVKMRMAGGRVDKHRMPHADEPAHALSPGALAFLETCLRECQARQTPEGLERALEAEYTRMTLLAREPAERLTIDLGLRLCAPDGATSAIDERLAIVESKSAGASTLADRHLRALGVRPIGSLSKFCLGVAMTRPSVPRNRLLPLLRRCAPGQAAGAGNPQPVPRGSRP